MSVAYIMGGIENTVLVHNVDIGINVCGTVFFILIESEGLSEYMEVIYLL